MALFRCNACKSVYADYYPTDDNCVKCKRGLIRIIEESITNTTNIIQHKEEDE